MTSRTRRRRMCVRVAQLAGIGSLALVGLPMLATLDVAASEDRERCSRGTRVLLKTRSGRVFQKAQEASGEPRTFACLFRRGRTQSLDDPFEGERVFPPPAMKLVGPLIGYGVEQTDIGLPGGTFVPVIDLRRSLESPFHVVRTNRAGSTRFAAVGSLALRRDGAVAWISCPSDSERGGRSRPACAVRGARHEVYKADGRPNERILLDRGPGIDPRSLRLKGSRVYWRVRGRLRRAVLR